MLIGIEAKKKIQSWKNMLIGRAPSSAARVLGVHCRGCSQKVCCSFQQKIIKIWIFLSNKASRRKALRAAMMEEFRVAEEAREANVKINQLSQEEVSQPSNDPKL